MINFIKDAVTAVSGIKSFLFNTDYRNNFDLQNVEFPCCVLTPIMKTNYDLKNIIRESAELQLSVVDLAPYEYTGDDLYAINKRCSDLALQVIANLQVKSKLDKELTFEFILPSGDELISGVMCNLQCTMKQGSCIGAPSYIDVIVQPVKRENIISNGKHVITPSSGFNAMREVEVDVNVDLKGSLQDKQVTITENGTTTIVADEGYEGLSSVEVNSEVWEGFMDDDLVEQLKDLNQVILQSIIDAKNGVVGSLSNTSGYGYTPPFVLKRMTTNGSASGSRFVYTNVLNIDMDVLFEPTIFSGSGLNNFFANPNIRMKRKIKLGHSHDYTNITSLKGTFENAYLFDIDFGNLPEQARNITDYSEAFLGFNFLKEIDMSAFNTRAGTKFNHFVGYSGGYIVPRIPKIKGIDLYNATNLSFFVYNLTCDVYADNWRLCNFGLARATMSAESVIYIIEHACGVEDGAVARTLSLDASTMTKFKAHPDYEYYVAMATEKLITIA